MSARPETLQSQLPVQLLLSTEEHLQDLDPDPGSWVWVLVQHLAHTASNICSTILLEPDLPHICWQGTVML